jgi:hypothetical protein
MLKRRRSNPYRDAKGRFSGDPDSPTEPADFRPVIAGSGPILEYTRFNVPKVYWVEALNNIGTVQHLVGFPMAEKDMCADPRWSQEYEDGYTVSQAILRYKEDIDQIHPAQPEGSIVIFDEKSKVTPILRSRSKLGPC